MRNLKTPPENDAAVVLFDGVCGLCNGTVDFLLRHDTRGALRFAALQSESGKRLLAECGLPAEALDSVVLVERGRCVTESTAVLQALAYLGYPWRVLSVLRVIPQPLRDIVYRYIARHRYAWFGRRDQCRIPTESEHARFLE